MLRQTISILIHEDRKPDDTCDSSIEIIFTREGEKKASMEKIPRAIPKTLIPWCKKDSCRTSAYRKNRKRHCFKYKSRYIYSIHLDVMRIHLVYRAETIRCVPISTTLIDEVIEVLDCKLSTQISFTYNSTILHRQKS